MSKTEEELRPFQVGIIVSQERFTDIIVRVLARDRAEANQKALALARARLRETWDTDDIFRDPFSVDWLDGALEAKGVSGMDYSDTSPGAYPEPDIDATEEER